MASLFLEECIVGVETKTVLFIQQLGKGLVDRLFCIRHLHARGLCMSKALAHYELSIRIISSIATIRNSMGISASDGNLSKRNT